MKLLILTLVSLIHLIQCTATLEREKRDDSGLLTMYEVMTIAKGLCEKVDKISGLLNSALLFGTGKALLRKNLPYPGPGVLGPNVYHFFTYMRNKIEYMQDYVSAYLEHKDPPEEPSAEEDDDTHEKLELGDLLNIGLFICKGTRIWFDVVASPAGDFIGLAHLRLPIKDFDHPLNWLKVFDFLNLESIPDRFRRLVDGKLGQITTAAPGFFSFGNSNEKKESNGGMFGGLFGGDKPTTPKSSGFLSGFLEKPVTTTVKSGLFGDGLFGKRK